MDKHHVAPKFSAAGLLIALGIIFGDIGTSPLYVLKAIVGTHPINSDMILGSISCVFWTLTLQTTCKYVILVLRADNKGEGGIFSLYTLVRRLKVKWLAIPAMIGGSALLADGILTPSISVSSAVEGLRYFSARIDTVPIVIAIIAALFIIQQFGTTFVGKFFGPIMLVWFSMLGILGLMALINHPAITHAINPYYAYELLAKYPGGYWLLGAVFLATTGAEGIYSDMGHCGKTNIRVSWAFVKLTLLLNYFGQGAWLLSHEGQLLDERNPFYSIMPEGFRLTGLIISTLATVVASQAMLSASFTLINEAIRLNFWPKVRTKFPSILRGQIYIPSVNWILFACCVGIILYFRESQHMEAAYGLTININMIMTSILFTYYMYLKKYPRPFIVLFTVIFVSIEIAFLVANLGKFVHGGWVSFLLSSIMIIVMFDWYQSRKIRNRFVDFVKLADYLPLIRELSDDLTIPKYSTHLVYLTSANNKDEIEEATVYSILQKRPKRADIYWFVHVDVLDEPYTMEYKVTELIKGVVIRVDFRLGFRVEPRINLMFRKVVEDMVRNAEVDITSRYESLGRKNLIGDFRFVLMEKFLSYENDLPYNEKIIMDVYFFLKHFSLPEEKAFGLDTSSVNVEKVPMIVSPVGDLPLKRVRGREEKIVT